MKKHAALLIVLILAAAVLSGCNSALAPAPSAAPTQAPTSAPTQIPTSAPTQAPAQLQKFSAVYMDTFDTVISLIGFAKDQETFNAHSNTVHEQYQRMHKLFDTYNSYEDEGVVSIFTLNQKVAAAPVEVDPVLFNLLKLCKENYELTRGQVNIAMGSVLSIWHDYRDAGLADPANAQLPPMDALKAATAHTNLDDVILDEENMTVFFADPNLKLDVGAVAKGFATELISQMLLESDMSSFIISAGGNVRLGNPPQDGRRAWGVGIQDPDGAVLGLSDIVETLFIANQSVVTSGDYQRFYTVDGVNYHHLIDPDTLMPATNFRSVSIITEDSGL
ncbi:MAG: FAD:protein FMN transferase, partial [Eubacteriales bacterium]|nr:FAD:protein FMN transferase [Eubacteriales bacterium]